jgi:hypothetical protein
LKFRRGSDEIDRNPGETTDDKTEICIFAGGNVRSIGDRIRESRTEKAVGNSRRAAVAGVFGFGTTA